MSTPTFSAFPVIPQRSSPEADFDAKMYALFSHFGVDFRNELLALLDWLEAEGIGGDRSPPITDFDAVNESGVRSIADYATVLNGPPQFQGGTGVTRLYAATNPLNASQVAYFLNGERIAVRRKRSGVWSAWRPVYTGGSVLGALADTDGLPSGGLIDSGSNSNGEYTALANGTLICTNGNAAITTAPAGFVGTIARIGGDKLWIGRWK